MKLQEWFAAYPIDITYREFSARTGISITSLYMYRVERTRPSKRVAEAIVKATKGSVTMEDLGWLSI